MPLKTTEQFIKDAIEVHDNTFGYANTVYTGAKNAIWITCKIHGNFQQKPNDHLNGAGCKQCGIMKSSEKRTKSNEDFIEGCEIAHDYKYDYSDTDYKGIYEIINVICPIHGSFPIVANNHLNGGDGCNKCAGRGLTLDERKQLLSDKHQGHYTYNDMIYLGAQKDIIITCPIHGNFKQQYSMHLSGHGCDDCGYDRVAEKLMLDWEEVLYRFKEKFGCKFNFSKSKFNGMNRVIEIICPTHGSFFKTPANFLNTTYGCGQCAPGQGINLNLPAILYYFQDTKTGYYKSGITSRSVRERFPESKYQQRMRLLSVEYFITGHEAKKKEKEILKEFVEFRVLNESWINRVKDTNGAKEFFTIDILQRDFLMLPAP